jgi:hypothetical protein
VSCSGQQLASSFNGKPKAPAWTALNNDDVLGMACGECHAVCTGAFGLPLNDDKLATQNLLFLGLRLKLDGKIDVVL